MYELSRYRYYLHLLLRPVFISLTSSCLFFWGLIFQHEHKQIMLTYPAIPLLVHIVVPKIEAGQESPSLLIEILVFVVSHLVAGFCRSLRSCLSVVSR